MDAALIGIGQSGTDRTGSVDRALGNRRRRWIQADRNEGKCNRLAGTGAQRACRCDRFAALRMYERYDWGQLARFHVLDTRQYRSYHACPKTGRGGSNSVTSSCSERLLPERTLLDQEQETWLANGFASSPAK